MARRRNPWGYKIDYDKAIAEDERQLARIERVIAAGVYPDDYTWIDAQGFTNKMRDGWEILAWGGPNRSIDMEVAYRFGLNAWDVAAFAHWLEFDFDNVKGAIEIPKGVKGAYVFAVGVVNPKLDDFDFLPANEAEAKQERKRIKATLARHKRNKKKAGL
jgi:hypothetical protein